MDSSSTTKLSFLLIVILGGITSLTPFAIDMYLPAMPSIAKEFGVSAGAIQITLTSFIAGFAVGQLFHGPLSDSFGRKPVLLLGTFFFALAAVISAASDSIDALMWARAAQGFSGAAGAVVVQAIVRDMFAKEDFARTMSFIILVMTIAPLLAPLAGGYLAVWFGWRSIFWLLALIAFVMIIAASLVIPETLKAENRQPFRLRTTMRHFFTLFTRSKAFGLIFTGAFSFAGMFAFLTAGSFIYIEIYGVSITNVGYLFGLNILLMMVMTTLNGKYVKRLGSHYLLRLGLTIQLIASLLLVLAQLLDLGLWGVVVPVMLFFSTISMVGSNSIALLLNEYPEIAGTVSSLAGSLKFGAGALVAAAVSMLPSGSVWPMILMMVLCSLLSMTFYTYCAKR
ncbi:drug resistance transporter, Bcr/CflA subfamily protein [Psychromonas ingrahamii 37]|uniref:Bcr/CflA family efflux transporter n=1 Tax=Psychromonas ingrahamii (strain DSM 17664 / CCUG 51855 / 37) TaxID=357804 RepID=A1SVR0_PSYIN|nr:Bcr/CflA family multidrug efflux MFS transporter [Psychromonas ingrahamii]ABM03575.1 drug resistance transporter, Bcr/CflA subfamily protein [Psychromonas ingrahamii 37]